MLAVRRRLADASDSPALVLLAEWLVKWSDPVRFVLNLGATVIWIYAIVDRGAQRRGGSVCQSTRPSRDSI